MKRSRVSWRAGKAWSQLMAPAVVAALVAGCAAGGAGSADHEARADNAECRALVDRAYERQNPPNYALQGQGDSPFSSTATPGVTSAGLGTQFHYNQALQSCERGSTANIAGSSNNTGQAVASPTITVVPAPGAH